MYRFVFAVFLFFVTSHNAHAFYTDMTQISIRPYLGVGYNFGATLNTDRNGIQYQDVLPNIFNSFGGHIGLRTRWLMVEFSTYGAIPSEKSGSASQYGISSASMDMISMRLTAIATLSHEWFGEQNNLLLLIGMLHTFSSINYSISNQSAVPSLLQQSVFGTSVELGIGYMRDITDHIAIRSEVTFSPIQISGVTNMMFNWRIGIFGFL